MAASIVTLAPPRDARADDSHSGSDAAATMATANGTMPAHAAPSDGDVADATNAHGDLDEVSFALGAATMLVTSIVGGSMFARANGPAVRNAGSEIIGYGFAAAPFVAHLPAHEYLRGLAFSATPLAMAIGQTTELAIDPTAIDEQGKVATRVPYALLFTFGMFSSVVGVVDSAFASKRIAALPVSLVPAVSPHAASLTLGGSF